MFFFFFSDTRSASLFCKLPTDFRIVNAICESKVRYIYSLGEIYLEPLTCQMLNFSFDLYLSLRRWFFEALAYPRTHQLVVTNGIAMAVVFFLVRIAVMPPYWAKVFGTFGTPAFERLGLSAQVAWILSCICLDILNTIWMYKIARGCYKVITGKLRGGKVDSKKTNFVNNHTD